MMFEKRAWQIIIIFGSLILLLTSFLTKSKTTFMSSLHLQYIGKETRLILTICNYKINVYHFSNQLKAKLVELTYDDPLKPKI